MKTKEIIRCIRYNNQHEATKKRVEQKSEILLTTHVEIKPVLSYWILPIEVDILTINKDECEFGNEAGNIKFP